MGPTQIDGLPAHVLIVHFVVVGVPLTALMVLASTLWPAARRRLGIATPAVALATLVSVPLATNAGEWLEKRVGDDPLVRRHASLGDTLLPWAVGLFVVAAAAWAIDRVATRTATAGADGAPGARGRVLTGTPVRAGLAVLALVVAVGAVVQVYRIGESGSEAAWHDRVSGSARPGDGD